MRWNPYIDLRCVLSRAVRAKCKQCDTEIAKGTYRIDALPVVGKKELLHVDCAAARAPDLAQRKVQDEAEDFPAEVRESMARKIPPGTQPAPRSFQRTPILDLSYDKDAASHKPCVFCGSTCPGEPGPQFGHALRAFSLDGERRFHPACAVQLVPGICKRVAGEASDRWPAEVRAFFLQVLPSAMAVTPRSPWRNTGGIPQLERSPSGRAACRFCQGKIAKGELRLGREQIYGMRRSPIYFHVGCYAKSDDFHARMLELVVLKAPPEITREEIVALGEVLPPTPEEDDDVPPLLDRLLAYYDATHRAPSQQPVDDGRPKLTENVVEFPRGFFS